MRSIVFKCECDAGKPLACITHHVAVYSPFSCIFCMFGRTFSARLANKKIRLIQRKPELNLSAANAHEMFSNVASALQIIDFGVSIDMSLFHKNQTFTHKFDKVDNRCPEMLEDKPWTYHVSICKKRNSDRYLE